MKTPTDHALDALEKQIEAERERPSRGDVYTAPGDKLKRLMLKRERLQAKQFKAQMARIARMPK